MNNKDYYLEQYNVLMDECYKDAREEIEEGSSVDVGAVATEMFEERANTDEVVGYYIANHGEYALKDWKDNIEGLKLSEQDKEVDRILKHLYADDIKNAIEKGV